MGALEGKRAKWRLPDALEMIRDGQHVDEVAAAFGITTSHLRRWIRDSGYDTATGLPATTTRTKTTGRRDEMWRDRGICAEVDLDLFFPENGRRDQGRAAQTVCRDCPVKAECLQWALEHEEWGIWGGTTEQERAKMKRGAA